MKISKRYKCTVNFDRPQEMILRGNYEFIYETDRFPITGSGSTKTSFVLVSFSRFMEKTERIVGWMKKQGLRPANFAELLAFGAAFPEEQRKYPITGLASMTMLDRRRRVVYLAYHGKRTICHRDWDDGWCREWHYLAVREK